MLINYFKAKLMLYSQCVLFLFCSNREEGDSSVSFLLQKHRSDCLPVDREENKTLIVVRRRHIFLDALHQFRCGIDFSKYLRVRFVGEPGIDTGGPMREFLHLLVSAIASGSLFVGEDTRKVPVHSVVELEKRIFFPHWLHVCCIPFCRGPSPNFLAPPIADYISIVFKVSSLTLMMSLCLKSGTRYSRYVFLCIIMIHCKWVFHTV